MALREDGQTFALTVARGDLEHWLAETLPVILIVYDAPQDTAYWVYVQAYFARSSDFNFAEAGETVTVRLPKANIVDRTAIHKFAAFKENILKQTQGVKHEDS